MRKKPDFSRGGARWIDPKFISDDVRAELLLHLHESPLTEEQKAALLSFANDMGQMVMDDEVKAGKHQRMQIEKIEANAKRLLVSLSALGRPAMEALQAHTRYLAFDPAPPIELDPDIKSVIREPDGSLLSSAWDWVDALEKATQYAASQYNLDKQSKPKQERARGYVSMLARCVRDLTGSAPPKDRSAWFAGFAACLGERLDQEIGSRLVDSAIDAIAR